MRYTAPAMTGIATASIVAIVAITGILLRSDFRSSPPAIAAISASGESLAAVSFGEVKPNSTTFFVMKLRNQTNGPVRISRVVADCSCTVPQLSASELAAGASVEIPVTYFASSEGGDVNRKIAFETSAGIFSITVTGFVKDSEMIRFIPNRPSLARTGGSSSATGKVYFFATDLLTDQLPKTVTFRADQEQVQLNLRLPNLETVTAAAEISTATLLIDAQPSDRSSSTLDRRTLSITIVDVSGTVVSHISIPIEVFF